MAYQITYECGSDACGTVLKKQVIEQWYQDSSIEGMLAVSVKDFMPYCYIRLSSIVSILPYEQTT